VPDARGIAVVDRVSQKQIGKWPLADRSANFPMALDPARRQILVIFRAPADLGVFSMTDGKPIATTEPAAMPMTCSSTLSAHASTSVAGLASLMFWKRRKGGIDESPLLSGARTSLFVPEIDRLLVAVRASSGEPAAIWIFRPMP
jgi:hypothetical protein